MVHEREKREIVIFLVNTELLNWGGNRRNEVGRRVRGLVPEYHANDPAWSLSMGLVGASAMCWRSHVAVTP